MNSTSLKFLYAVFLKHRLVVTDSRQISQGAIFFALKGDRFDGNKFAAHALEAGAAYVVVDDSSLPREERYIHVDDVLQSLQQLAAHHRQQMGAKVLAITGTNGKTTTKELIAAVLGSEYNIIFTAGNLNNHIGVPLTLLSIQEETEIAVVEMGANHIGEIESYCTWAQPDYGIITNIGKAHLEGFGSIEGVRQAKSELYRAVAKYGKMIFRHVDAPFLAELTPDQTPCFTYGSKDADVCGTATPDMLKLHVNLQCPQDFAGEYPSNLVGQYNLPNVLCALAVGIFFNVGRQKMQQALASYEPSNNRSQLLQKNSNTIILDAYNANPTSMALALENLAKLAMPNKWVLLGAMKEMGPNADAEHYRVAELAASLGLRQVLLVGNEYRNAAVTRFPIFEHSAALKGFLQENPIKDATILIKGSRGSQMELVLEALD